MEIRSEVSRTTALVRGGIQTRCRSYGGYLPGTPNPRDRREEEGGSAVRRTSTVCRNGASEGKSEEEEEGGAG